MTFPRMVLWLALLIWTRPIIADEPRPALLVRLDKPDAQARAVIDLFRGSKVAHPAAALAAWKRASREPDRLGKPLEALIAAFNPAMADELRILDGAELALWLDRASGRLAWGASLPDDDGTFAALATAFVLSGGAAEPAMAGLAVDRLGPPGSPLMAQSPRSLLIGGSLGGLMEARLRSDRPQVREAGNRLRMVLDPGAFDGSRSLAILRIKSAVEELRGSLTASAGLTGSTLLMDLVLKRAWPGKSATVEPGWLDWIPGDRAAAAFAFGIDPTAENWNAAFRIVDRVEKVDPGRQNVAPARLRLDLLARGLGQRLDNDLFPHLKGVVGWVGTEGGVIDRAFLMLQLDDEGAAMRIFERSRMAGAVPPAEPGPTRGKSLGQIEGRTLRLFRFGRAVIATWGEGVVESALQVRNDRQRSALAVFPGLGIDSLPECIAAIWPSRLPGLVPADTPLAQSLDEAPPILWSGRRTPTDQFQFKGSWGGLDATVKRFLELIPLDLPNNR